MQVSAFSISSKICFYITLTYFLLPGFISYLELLKTLGEGAGCSAAIATKWPPDSISLGEIVKRFYYNLSNSEPNSSGLRLDAEYPCGWPLLSQVLSTLLTKNGVILQLPDSMPKFCAVAVANQLESLAENMPHTERLLDSESEYLYYTTQKRASQLNDGEAGVKPSDSNYSLVAAAANKTTLSQRVAHTRGPGSFSSKHAEHPHAYRKPRNLIQKRFPTLSALETVKGALHKDKSTYPNSPDATKLSGIVPAHPNDTRNSESYAELKTAKLPGPSAETTITNTKITSKEAADIKYKPTQKNSYLFIEKKGSCQNRASLPRRRGVGQKPISSHRSTSAPQAALIGITPQKGTQLALQGENAAEHSTRPRSSAMQYTQGQQWRMRQQPAKFPHWEAILETKQLPDQPFSLITNSSCVQRTRSVTLFNALGLCESAHRVGRNVYSKQFSAGSQKNTFPYSRTRAGKALLRNNNFAQHATRTQKGVTLQAKPRMRDRAADKSGLTVKRMERELSHFTPSQQLMYNKKLRTITSSVRKSEPALLRNHYNFHNPHRNLQSPFNTQHNDSAFLERALHPRLRLSPIAPMALSAVSGRSAVIGTSRHKVGVVTPVSATLPATPAPTIPVANVPLTSNSPAASQVSTPTVLSVGIPAAPSENAPAALPASMPTAPPERMRVVPSAVTAELNIPSQYRIVSDNAPLAPALQMSSDAVKVLPPGHKIGPSVSPQGEIAASIPQETSQSHTSNSIPSISTPPITSSPPSEASLPIATIPPTGPAEPLQQGSQQLPSTLAPSSSSSLNNQLVSPPLRSSSQSIQKNNNLSSTTAPLLDSGNTSENKALLLPSNSGSESSPPVTHAGIPPSSPSEMASSPAMADPTITSDVNKSGTRSAQAAEGSGSTGEILRADNQPMIVVQVLAPNKALHKYLSMQTDYGWFPRFVLR